MAKLKQGTIQILVAVAITSLVFGLYSAVFLASSRANIAQQSLSSDFNAAAVALLVGLPENSATYAELLGVNPAGQDNRAAIERFLELAPLFWFNQSDTPASRLAGSYETWKSIVNEESYENGTQSGHEAATLELAAAYIEAARQLNRAGERVRVAFDLTFLFLGFFLSLSAAASVWMLARLREARLKEYMSHEAFVRTLHAEEATRKTVALELHDDLSQDIAAARMLCERNMLSGDNQLSARAAAILAETNRKIRLLSSELRPPELDTLGLAAALQAICDEAARRFDFVLRYEGPSQIQRLGEDTELGIYRIMREATSNAAKYASSGNGVLSCALHTEEDSRLCLLVSLKDSGLAPVPATVPNSVGQTSRGSGLGLQAMSERAKAIGAELKVDLRPEGSTVALSLRVDTKKLSSATRSTL